MAKMKHFHNPSDTYCLHVCYEDVLIFPSFGAFRSLASVTGLQYLLYFALP